MIVGNIKQIKQELISDEQVLGNKGSANVSLKIDFTDDYFNGFSKSFFYAKKSVNCTPIGLEYNNEENTILLPQDVFRDDGLIFIGMLGTKTEKNNTVYINTKPLRFAINKALNPNDIGPIPESSWMDLVNTYMDNIKKNEINPAIEKIDTIVYDLEQKRDNGYFKGNDGQILPIVFEVDKQGELYLTSSSIDSSKFTLANGEIEIEI